MIFLGLSQAKTMMNMMGWGEGKDFVEMVVEKARAQILLSKGNSSLLGLKKFTT